MKRGIELVSSPRIRTHGWVPPRRVFATGGEMQKTTLVDFLAIAVTGRSIDRIKQRTTDPWKLSSRYYPTIIEWRWSQDNFKRARWR